MLVHIGDDPSIDDKPIRYAHCPRCGTAPIATKDSGFGFEFGSQRGFYSLPDDTCGYCGDFVTEQRAA